MRGKGHLLLLKHHFFTGSGYQDECIAPFRTSGSRKRFDEIRPEALVISLLCFCDFPIKCYLKKIFGVGGYMHLCFFCKYRERQPIESVSPRPCASRLKSSLWYIWEINYSFFLKIASPRIISGKDKVKLFYRDFCFAANCERFKVFFTKVWTIL